MCIECPRGYTQADQKQAAADKDFTMCKCCPTGSSPKQLRQCFVDGMKPGAKAVEMTFEVTALIALDPGVSNGDWGDARDWCIPAHHAMLQILKDAGYCVESNSADWKPFDIRSLTA